HGRGEGSGTRKYQRATYRISSDANFSAIVDFLTEQRLGAVDLAGLEDASVGIDVRDYGLEGARLARPSQRQIREYDLSTIHDLLTLLDSARPIPGVDALIAAR